MDALSQVLGTIRTTGAVFYDLACGAPWGFGVPPVNEAADLLAPGTGRLVNYHVIMEGRARVRLEGSEDLQASAGDVVVLPHGDAHVVTSGARARIVDARWPVEEVLSGRPRTVRIGGTGETTRIVCGFFGCEALAERLFLAGLPRAFKVSLRADPSGEWLEQSVRHLVAESASPRAGTAAVLSRMAEVLFVETLRRYMRALPERRAGWLAAARDPLVGGALARLHRAPHRPWTTAGLAAAVGASRSVLTERFSRFLGEPPLRYLARWRLQLAARSLETTGRSVAEVAAGVGYESEASFNRAFKREFGLPPARYRSAHRKKLAASEHRGRTLEARGSFRD